MTLIIPKTINALAVRRISAYSAILVLIQEKPAKKRKEKKI
jgi:hypothetical protein